MCEHNSKCHPKSVPVNLIQTNKKRRILIYAAAAKTVTTTKRDNNDWESNPAINKEVGCIEQTDVA